MLMRGVLLKSRTAGSELHHLSHVVLVLNALQMW